MKEHAYLEDDEMLRRGIDALIRTLGPIEAARFLTLPRGHRLDSVKRHHRWQKGLDTDRLFDQVFGSGEAPERSST